MLRTIAIGEQDFSRTIENQYFYVDKTGFIKEWWENGDAVSLITRPRRFGKTLAMRMVESFFSVNYAGRGELFEGLSIWKDEKYKKLQGTYPVIFLSFAGIKDDSYEKTRQRICQLIVNLYADYSFLLQGGLLTDNDKVFFKKVAADMDDVTATMALHQLSKYLSHYYNKKVILLLDEYDTPMQEAYVNNYWGKLVSFTRSLFNNTFKTNPFLERAIMTGITRVSKESVFSDLNNLTVVTTTSGMYETAFGFTEDEMVQALEEYGLGDQETEVRNWYDGFRFGKHGSIYNPWSIVNFLKFKEFKMYWANTSSHHLVGRLVQKSGIKVKYVMEELLKGGSFRAQIDEEIIFSDLDKKNTAVWSLLLASGYLKVLGTEQNHRQKTEYTLALTNLEVCFLFNDMVLGWFSNSRLDYHDFSGALIMGNKEFMNEYVNEIASETFSFFDTGIQPSEFKQPENFYHGFVLGLIVDLRKRYHITSNRESGRGRYDVMLEPLDTVSGDGILLEFKVQDPGNERTLEDTVQSAIRQVIHRQYAASLEAKGVPRSRIRVYGFAFRGKEVLIGGGYMGQLAVDDTSGLSLSRYH